MALKGVILIPMSCSINAFNAVLNWCEGELLNRFDPSAVLPVIKCSFGSDKNEKNVIKIPCDVLQNDHEY